LDWYCWAFLVEPDEARYSEIPREMVASADWLTPRLDGFKYFEKPALQYWITAASFKLFGESNATARLWLVISAFLCAMFIGFLAYQLSINHREEDQNKESQKGDISTALFAFIMTLTSLQFTIFGHVLTLDMSLTLFLTMATGALIIAQECRSDPVKNRNWMLAGWALMGLAVLTKGLIGIVLPGGAVFFYMLWQRDWQIFKHLHLIKGILVLLLVTAPWFIAVSRANPGFAWFFFIHEHFQRYTTTSFHRTGPMAYFIPIFLLGISPWLVISLKALFKPDFSWRAEPEKGFQAERLIWVYILVIFVFFSLSDSKLPAYILPIFPFVAVLAAQRLRQIGIIKGDQWTLAGLGLLFLVAGIIITRFANHKIPTDLYADYRPWVIAGAISLLAGAAALFKWKNEPEKAMVAAGVLTVLGFQLFLAGFQTIAPARSSAREAAAINKAVNASVPVFTVNTYPQSLPFYLNRTVQIVGFKGELEMGIKAEPQKWIPSISAFEKQWNQLNQAVAVMNKSTYQQLRNKKLPMTILYQGIRLMVVLKHK